MEIINDGTGKKGAITADTTPNTPAQPTTTTTTVTPSNISDVTGSTPKEPSEFDKIVVGTMQEVREEYEAKHSSPHSANTNPKVNVAEHVEKDYALKLASFGDEPPKSTEIEEKHKDAFLDCLVSGERYTETFSLFNDRITLILRSRTHAETTALEAYLRRQVQTGRIRANAEYAAEMRKCLFVAQVAQINEITYPVMEKPLFYVETSSDLVQPKWLDQLAVWDLKGDGLVAAIFKCILEFEARYWAMINAAKDTNFWKAG